MFIVVRRPTPPPRVCVYVRARVCGLVCMMRVHRPCVHEGIAFTLRSCLLHDRLIVLVLLHVWYCVQVWVLFDTSWNDTWVMRGCGDYVRVLTLYSCVCAYAVSFSARSFVISWCLIWHEVCSCVVGRVVRVEYWDTKKPPCARKVWLYCVVRRLIERHLTNCNITTVFVSCQFFDRPFTHVYIVTSWINTLPTIRTIYLPQKVSVFHPLTLCVFAASFCSCVFHVILLLFVLTTLRL